MTEKQLKRYSARARRRRRLRRLTLLMLVLAAAFLLIEEVLVSYTIYWQMGLGAVLLIVVLVAPNGLLSLRRGMWSKR